MNNASEYLTGDDMIAFLTASIDDASEAATYSPADNSREALIARNRAAFTRRPERGALVDYYDISLGDHRGLEALGLIAVFHAAPGQWYSLTDAGAALGVSLRG